MTAACEIGQFRFLVRHRQEFAFRRRIDWRQVYGDAPFLVSFRHKVRG